MSSAESFVMMLAQCPQVATMGDRTAGSSGNPYQLSAGAGIHVNLPRWNPLTADGKPFDRVGIPPAVAIEAGKNAFHDDRDPVLEAALKRLREAKAPEGEVLKSR
jgi:C-terminal processing protease CtpA/Prc